MVGIIGLRLASVWASMGVGGRLVRGTTWSLAGSISSRLLAVAASVLVARILGKEEFGAFGVLQSTLITFQAFAAFGLGLTAGKYVAECRTSDPERAGRVLGLSYLVALCSSMLLAVILLMLAPWLANGPLARPSLLGGLTAGSLVVLFSGLLGAQAGAFSGFEAFDRQAVVSLVGGLASACFTVAGAAGMGTTGAILGLALGLATNVLIAELVLRRVREQKGIRLAFHGCQKEIGMIRQFSIPALLSGVMTAPAVWLCNLALVHQGDGYQELALFNAANVWFLGLAYVPGVVGQVMLPVLSEQLATGQRKGAQRAIKLALAFAVVCSGSVAVILSLGSRQVLALYGPGYASAWRMFVVMMLAATVYSAVGTAGQLVAACGRMWVALCMNLGWAFVVVAGSWLMASHGAFGLSLARLAAYLVHALWVMAFVGWWLHHNAGQSQQTAYAAAKGECQ